MALRTIIDRETIQKRIAEMAAEIERDFEGLDLIALCVLKGAMFFMTDLLRAMERDVAIDVLQVSSYGTNTFSSGVVTILKEPQLDMRGKAVLIVEDIIDSGQTIREVRRYIQSRGAVDVRVATLLDKRAARKVEFVPDYAGFIIDPLFVVGYGLDYAEQYRNLPDVRVWEE